MMPLRRRLALFLLAAPLAVAPLAAQQGPPPPRPPARGARAGGPALGMPPGRWWDNPENAQTLGLTADQVRQMDAVFAAARDQLIDLDANVRKADAALRPLLGAEPFDRAAAAAAVDRLVAAHAALEKANSEMLLALRQHLSAAQWNKLERLRPPRPPQPPPPGRPPIE